MIEMPDWAKLKKIVDGLTAPTKICTGDSSHYMLYVAKDGIVCRYRMNKEISGEQTKDDGLDQFEADYLSTFL